VSLNPENKKNFPIVSFRGTFFFMKCLKSIIINLPLNLEVMLKMFEDIAIISIGNNIPRKREEMGCYCTK
jgi:hypothetical protein